MMIYYLYIYFMLNIFLVIFILMLYFLINKSMMLMEFEFMSIMSIKINYIVLLDWINLLFMSLILIISMMVMIYSIEYMGGDLNMNRFFFLIIMFVLSMIFMIISPSMLSILLGWDGLGLVSYCLVIYYQNESSFNSGMVTVLSNRIGDVLIMLSLGLMVYLGSLNFMFFNKLGWLNMMLIIFISMTKSAQIPFSSWLPQAMAAPTPVSSLVHSSTLVTAGVYMLIRFNYLIKMNYMLSYMLMIVSLLTMLMSGIVASMENDLKKIIALSTLSQLGFMIFSLSLNMVEVSYFHLVIHALFKSMLFMCAGIIIHNMMFSQDIRFISLVYNNMPIVSLIFNCSSFALMGLPFLSGFYSKDKILDLYLMGYENQIKVLLLFICMGLTSGYMIRLIYYSFIKVSKFNMFKKNYSIMSIMVYSMLMLFMFSIFMGYILSWLIFSMKNKIFLSVKLKIMIFNFMMLGIMISLMMSMMLIKLVSLKKLYKYLFAYYYMWMLSMIYKFEVMNLFMFMNKLYSKMELGWNEYLYGKNMISFLKKMYLYNYINNFFLFILIIVYYLILIIMFI